MGKITTAATHPHPVAPRAIAPDSVLSWWPDHVAHGFGYPDDCATILLPALPESVSRARRFCRSRLDQWRAGALQTDVALIASELVSNALRHGFGVCGPAAGAAPMTPAGVAPQAPACFPFRMARRGEHLICLVNDPTHRLPVNRNPADRELENGRGLGIVQALSTRWGWTLLPDDWKSVWAVFTLDGAAY
ncbi:ATP-binding protein [Allonocardiopsis opalescens]|nr:ATP-binding protein [Allonocardiopsis opalescens]